MKTNKREFNKKLILLVCSAVYFGLVLILTSFISHAASDEYYFPMEQNKNLHFSGSTTVIDTYFDSENNYIFTYYVSSNWGAATDHFEIVYWPKSEGYSLFGEIQTNAYEFSLYKVGTTSLNYASYDVYWSGGTVPSVVNVNTIPEVNVMNRIFVSSSYTSNTDYSSNFQLYTSNSSLRKIVLLYSGEVPPTPTVDNITDDTEKPIFSDYTVDWTTGKPTFDSEHPFDSLFSIMSWSFGKLADTVTSGFNFIVDSLNWSLQTFLNNVRAKFQLVVDAINDIGDLIEDFIQSVNGFFSDIKEKLSDFFDDFVEFADLFIHPFDADEFEEQISDCKLISEYEQLLDNCEIIREVFETAQEKDTFVLYIDFENPFADSEHKIIKSEISFNWLVPLRPNYRPFLWFFALLDCFIGGCQLLSSIIGGKAK